MSASQTPGTAEPFRPNSLFPSSSFRLGGWHRLILAILILLLAGLLAFVIFQPIKVLPRIRLAPGFALTAQDGRQISNEDLRGQFVLYNFTYTHCQAAGCPETDQVAREVYQHLGEAKTDNIPVTLVTISFDPARDTPDALHAYAQSLGADPARWHFVTGDAGRIKAIIGSGFEVYYEAQPDGSFKFSPSMILVDGWGIIRAIYRPATNPPDASRILKHFDVLAQEVRNSKGVAKLGYEAAHLFLCYAS